LNSHAELRGWHQKYIEECNQSVAGSLGYELRADGLPIRANHKNSGASTERVKAMVELLGIVGRIGQVLGYDSPLGKAGLHWSECVLRKCRLESRIAVGHW
jgi:hypothetical protein